LNVERSHREHNFGKPGNTGKWKTPENDVEEKTPEGRKKKMNPTMWSSMGASRTKSHRTRRRGAKNVFRVTVTKRGRPPALNQGP